MSRDKPPCPGTSRDKITFLKKHKKQEKDILKQEKGVLNRKGSSETGRDILNQEKYVLKQEKMF
jgi:hypothetical protein